MPTLLGSIAISACLGALIGLIRQWGEQTAENNDFAGVRTHTLWAVLGAVGMAGSLEYTPLAFPAVVLAVTAHLVAQRVADRSEDAPGSTSFAAALLTMFCGALVVWNEEKSAILVAAMTMLMLGAKQPIHQLTRKITRSDIVATLQFAAISGVVLPLLPNRAMGPFDAFNPFKTWLMVVLICGLSFAGYVAIRLVGPRSGILLTGVLGGLASSTASTLAFSRRSRESPKMSDHFALAVVAACTVMLPRVVIATGFVNRDFGLSLVVPFALMAVPGVLFGIWVWFFRRPTHHEGDTPNLGNPLGLSTAIKFAVLYSLVAFLVIVVREKGWTQSLMPIAFVSGLTDMDAISLSLAGDTTQTAAASATTAATAATAGATLASRAVVLAAVSNTLLKAGMAIALGSPGLRLRVALVLGTTAILGVVWILFGSRLTLGASTP